jgi:type VI secretion system protein ImpL
VKTIKYFIAALALIGWLVLAWFIGSWLHLQGNSLWILRIALAFIGVLAFALVIWWFIVRDKESSGAPSPGAGGDEIDILIREAETRLQASKLGRSAKVGGLPLFLVMGETGSAKTSVVLHSGLEPELLAGQTVQDKTPVPTRTANLWYTRQVIFAEAGGSMLQDRARWTKLVKKLAPGQLHSVFGKGAPAPRAALVCVDCESFMRPGAPEALAASVDRIRTRLREISQLLGISLPVYILFTRADRLQFFQDYVRNLSQDEASVVFGATLPMVTFSTGVYAEQETARITGLFENLFQSLADRRVNLLAQEFDATKLPTIYEFPREFRKLRPLLVQLIVDLCRPSQLRTGPFLRGFYFTGVRPVTITTTGPSLVREEPIGQPNAASAAEHATGFFDYRKARAQMAQQAPVQEVGETRRVPQWVFLPHVFSDVLLKDTSALTASASSTKTSTWRRILLATAMVFLLIFIIGFIVSFVRNKNLESQVVTAAQGISDSTLTGQQLASIDMLNKLETLRQSVGTLSDYQQNGAPWSMRWGLYAGNALYPDVRRIYFQHFAHLLFGEAQANLVQTLSALPAAPGPNDQYEAAYNTLKAYLITTSNHDKSTTLFLSPVLMKAWIAGRDIDEDRLQLAQKQFDFYSEQLKLENPYSSENDTLVVARARNYISQFSGGERVYRFMLAEAAKANPSINFNKKFPGSAETVIDRTEVSGAFTKGGWAFMQNALQNLPKYFSGEQWVLGQENSSNVDLAKLGTDLRSRYQQDFIGQWRAFLKSGTVVRYSGLPDATQKLLKLSGNTSPLLALFCVAAQNTAVDQPDVVKAFQPVQSVVSPSSCQDQYIGDANKPYVAGLSNLQVCLDAANNALGDKDAAKAKCLDNVSAAQQAANQMGQGFKIDQDGHIDQTVQSLLLAPITSVSAVLKPGPVSGAGLCAQMSPLQSKFPFSPQATAEATPQDLGAFFDPSTGALGQFYTSALKNLLLPSATGYIANPAATQAINPAFLAFFNRAAGVQRALYAGPPGQLAFKYALRPHPTESVTGLTMNIDGQTLNYTGGNSSYQQFTWPGTGGGITLTVKIQGGSDFGFANYAGTWGVFHFFSDADKTVPNGSVYNVEWIGRGSGGHPLTAPNGKPLTVQFDLDTLGAPPILQKGYFASLRCVSNVAK